MKPTRRFYVFIVGATRTSTSESEQEEVDCFLLSGTVVTAWAGVT